MKRHPVTAACAWLVIAISLAQLAVWWAGPGAVQRLMPNAPDAPPLTALMLILLASSLLVPVAELGVAPHPRGVRLRGLLVGAAMTIGAFSAVQFAADLGPSLELIMFRDAVLELGGNFPGRPSPRTAACVVMMGAAILFWSSPREGLRRIALTLVLLASIIPWIALFGYLSLAIPLYVMPGSPGTGMSPLAAAALLVLAVGASWARPKEGLVGMLLAPTSGGAMVRLFVPAAIMVPMLLSWAVIYTQSADPSDTTTIIALSWGANSLLFAVLIFRMAARFHRADLYEQRLLEERERMVSSIDQGKESARALNAALRRDVDQMNDQLERYVSELEQAKHENLRLTKVLEKRNEELETFVSWITADIEGPMIELDALVRSDPSARKELGQHVQRVRRSVERFADFSRISTGRLEEVQVDLRALFEGIMAGLDETIRARAVKVSLAELPVVSGDRAHLARVFQGILARGVSQARDAPELEVEAKHCDGEWVISVRDNGPELLEEQRVRLFRIFGGSDEDLGLALGAHIVARHGGRVWVESEAGAGSTFYVALPIREPARA